MNNKNLTFAIVAAVILIGLAAYSFPGSQETAKTESTQKSVINGTTTESTTTREITTDDDGSQTSETSTKTTVDPEGLMNKKTIENTTETQKTP